MKPALKVSLLAATIFLAVGCQKEESKTPEKAEAAASAEMTFKNDDEKAAYAIGVSFADYLKTSLDKPTEIGIDIDKDIVLKGIEDSFAGTPALDQEAAHAALSSLDKRVAEQTKKQNEEKAAKAKKDGDAFRAEFAKEEGVVTTESGLMYKELEAGEGDQPKETDTVQVNYKGTLIDGTQFDSSYDRGQPATFPLNRVIPGWTEGVQHMKVGSKYKFVIPPELAYGDQSTPSIPANSTLVFEVELLKIEKPADKAAAEKDEAAQ